MKFNSQDFFEKVNLHIHSTFSDGKVDFNTLVNEALELNLECFSITDHNTVCGYKNFELPNNMITGVEFDCFYAFNLPHILGYKVDVNNKELNELTTEFQKGLFELPKRILSSRSPKKVIDAIHKAGGIAVLAHPCCYWCLSLENFIKKLVDMGLDGIEVYYPYDRVTRVVKFHSRKTVLKLAKKYNLIITGGMDSHAHIEREKINGNLFE